MLGTSSGVKDLEDISMGNADKSSNVQAAVDFSGPMNFLTMDDEHVASGIRAQNPNAPYHSTSDSSESLYMRAQVTTIPDKVKEANPTTYISKNTPPFFIEHRASDPVVPVQQSKDLASSLKNVIGEDKVTLNLVDGAQHIGDPDLILMKI